MKKKSGFFIRFTSLLIDLTIFCLIGIFSSLMCIGKNEKGISIINSFLYYYLWLLLLIVLILIQFILIPLITKGKTIGMLICGLELTLISNDESIYTIIIKRQILGSIPWIITILLYIAFVTPDIINKIIITKQVKESDLKLDGWEMARLTIPSTLSSFLIFFQSLLLMTIGINKQKQGFVDKVTKSQIIWKNKLDPINEQIKTLRIIEPEKEKEILIEWKE